MMKSLLLAVTTIILAHVDGGIAASAHPTPRASSSPLALYQALVRTSFGARELPPGFTARATPSATRGGPRQAIGEVGFRIDGPAHGSTPTIDVILYGVLPTDRDAVAVFAAGPQAVLNPRDHRITGARTTRLLGLSARIVTVQVTNIDGSGGKGIVGYSYCSVRVGSVVVTAGSGIMGDRTTGDTPTAIVLARAAMAHLSSVRGARR